MDRLAIGIDTGGTFTDGVLLQYKTRRILRTVKTLTTRDDLRKCVVRAIDQLEIDSPEAVKLVGVSSTLATNSIAMGNTRRVGLLLIGYDPKLIEEFGFGDKLSADVVAHFEGGHSAQGVQKATLDTEGIREWVEANKDDVDAIAISSYFSPLNPDHEERAFEIVRKHCDLAVVMGHQLSTHLDSIKRAATAALNASLVYVMHEFIEAVQAALKRRNIMNAALMIVRGDGTLMPCDEAVQKPVETILSGPAASAIGGDFITRKRSSLVIDVGGTTTDMAFVDNGSVVLSPNGARVGNIRTSVATAHIRTVCLGCDSLVHVDKYGAITVGPEKITPLCRFASTRQEVRDEILGLKNKSRNTWRESDLEYWALYNDAHQVSGDLLDDRAKQVMKLLADGPKSVSCLMEAVGVYHADQLSREQLRNYEIIEVAAMSPTDIFQAKEDLDLWDAEVADQAVRCYAHIHGKTRSGFIDDTIASIVKTLVEEAIIFLASHDLLDANMPERIQGSWGKWLLQELLTDDSRYLSVNIDSRFPITGVGAPADHFLRQVARVLSAPFVLPRHHEVANAIGAVAGSIMEIREARIFEQTSEDTHTFIILLGREQLSFSHYEEACEYAEKACKKKALEAVTETGVSDPYVELKTSIEGGLTRVTARAVGSPKISD